MKNLKKLNVIISDYMNEVDGCMSSHEIISMACEILPDFPGLKGLCEKCMNNADMRNSLTPEEYELEAHCVIEELSGTLGEVFYD